MIQTYWQLGQRIVEEEQQGDARAEYGKALISRLSRYLGNLSWSHVCLIMRLDNTAERNYYLSEASSQNWSVRQLERKY